MRGKRTVVKRLSQPRGGGGGGGGEEVAEGREKMEKFPLQNDPVCNGEGGGGGQGS